MVLKVFVGFCRVVRVYGPSQAQQAPLWHTWEVPKRSGLFGGLSFLRAIIF